jgi:hypothetical protein
MHACTRCALCLALPPGRQVARSPGRRVAWLLVTGLPAVAALLRRCHGAVEPPHPPHGSTSSTASHHTPRNYDLRRWRFLCRDWRLALPARRRGYRWAAALLTLRFQTSASTQPTLWPSNYSTRGWVSARLWLRLGLNLAPTCPQPALNLPSTWPLRANPTGLSPCSSCGEPYSPFAPMSLVHATPIPALTQALLNTCSFSPLSTRPRLLCSTPPSRKAPMPFFRGAAHAV